MIIAKIKGGLGNQLFQYAAGAALAKRLSSELVLDTSFFPEQSLRSFKLDKLSISGVKTWRKANSIYKFLDYKPIRAALVLLDIKVIPAGPHRVYCQETRSKVHDWFFNIDREEIYINGYFQSEKYFSCIADEIRKSISPNYSPSMQFTELEHRVKEVNSIAVHVRRGDFLKAQHNYNPRHYLLNEQYYLNALTYVEQRIEKPEFFWFSDDIEWVKKIFGERKDFHFVKMTTENADIDEMMLMKRCNHIIAANSTFSWWASWLNENPNAIHICPDKRYGNESMIPENWIKIMVR